MVEEANVGKPQPIRPVYLLASCSNLLVVFEIDEWVSTRHHPHYRYKMKYIKATSASDLEVVKFFDRLSVIFPLASPQIAKYTRTYLGLHIYY